MRISREENAAQNAFSEVEQCRDVCVTASTCYYILHGLALGNTGNPEEDFCGSAVSVLERLEQDGDTITLGRLLGGGIEEEKKMN